MNYRLIDNLLWDTENLEINGKKYFTWQEAMDAAKSVGKRLPTKEEFDNLLSAGYKFDPERKGMFFAYDMLFFPISGCQYYGGRNLSLKDHGYLWSSSNPEGSSYSWNLIFSGSSAYMEYSYTTNRFPVRCVQDISYNSTIEEKIEDFKEDIDEFMRKNLNNESIHNMKCLKDNGIYMGDYVFVKWIDSVGTSSKWIIYNKDEYRPEVGQVISCGKLLYEDKYKISLALSFIEETDFVNAQFNGEIVIPKACIQDIKVIEFPF